MAKAISTSEHAVCSAPADIAVERNAKWDRNAALSLQAFEICDALTRCLNLDGKRSNGRDDIKGVMKNAITGKTWVKFPDCRSCFHRPDACDNRHEIGYCEVDDMSQTRKALCVTIEGVDVFTTENALNSITCSVVIARIVGGDAEKLARIESCSNGENDVHTLVE